MEITELATIMYQIMDRQDQQERMMQEELASMKRQMAFLVAENSLDGGLLPAISEITLLEIQIFRKQDLTSKQKQAGHTEWSLRINASVNGKKIKKAINVALYNGPAFADKVFNAEEQVPETIAAVAKIARDDPDDNRYGMFKQYTSGKGSPRSRRQFAVLQGHLIGEPVVEIWIDEHLIRCETWRPGKGTHKDHALWYGICKPNSI